jgi:phage virion morphogenesis protein
MSGAFVEVSAEELRRSLALLQAQLGNLEPFYRDAGKYLLRSHRDRWARQVSPDGGPWQALSPAYLKAKPKNKDKILVLDGKLQQLHYALDAESLAVGTDRIYGAIHQFGGKIKHKARQGSVYFHHDPHTGEVGNRFVKKGDSTFAQDVTVGEHETDIPARPFLGLSGDDEAELLALLADHLAAGQPGR